MEKFQIKSRKDLFIPIEYLAKLLQKEGFKIPQNKPVNFYITSTNKLKISWCEFEDAK